MRLPSRRTALILQYCGMAVVLAWFLLTLFMEVNQVMTIIYFGAAFILLGAGVYIRRKHDGD